MFESLDNAAVSFDEAERLLTSAGVDTSNPAVQEILNNESARRVLFTPVGGGQISNLARRFPVNPQTAQYFQVADTYGLNDLQQNPVGNLLSEIAFGGLKGQGVPASQAIADIYPQDANFRTDPTSGATIFKNGVIVDPQGQVVMPPGKAVPGSLPWLQEVTRNWSEADITSWRKKLVDYGFLPKGSEKQKGWSVELRAALVNFHHARYLNGGKPIKSDTNAVRAQPTDLGPLRPVIEEEVRKQLAGTLGQLPGEAQVKQWTDFIVHQGMALQRQKQLTPSTALQVAESRAGNQVYNSPAGQYAVGVEENTSLADALHNAVMVTQGLG